jgi:hypothetical protein
MKIKIVFLIYLSLQWVNAQQKSEITDVKVYLDGAEINRTASVTLNPGTSEFTFNKLSPYIEESSIQVSGLKNSSILSINYAINYLSKQKQNDSIRALENKLEELDTKIQYQQDIIAGYNEEFSLIQSNKHLGNETEVVSLEKLKAFASYYRTRITELKVAIHKSNKLVETHQKNQTDIRNQLAEFNSDDKTQTGEIKLKLNSDIATKLDLKISYTIKNAGWFPVYDLKADKINSPINFEYKAHVFQNSGCDWTDVNLVLSTGDPNTNNEKPFINPKYLNFVNAYSNYQSLRATRRYNYKYNPTVKTVSGIITTADDGLPLPGANVIEKGTSNGTTTDFDGKYTLKTTSGNTIVFTYIGMRSEELPIHSSTMNVTLSPDNSLDEVVVIGYGTKKRTFGNRAEQVFDEDFDEESYIEPINYTSNGNSIEEGITSTSFKIDKTYSIASDGDVTVIEVDTFSIPASYNYFAAPVLNENVFLTAKIGNWEQYNLLPAEANIYFEGSYAGKTNINPAATTDSLNISLGVDPNIVVKRNQLNDFKKTTFIGSNKVIYQGYEIEIKNNKSSAIQLSLYDRIPKSQNRDIKIDDIETGASDYNEDKGILKWILNLKPGASEKVKHAFSVKYPKGKSINL